MPLYSPVAVRTKIKLAARGLLDETFPQQIATSGANLTSQQILLGLLGLAGGDIVTNIAVCVTQAGAGTAPTTIKLGLVDTTGQVLATTANVASDTKWTASTGPKTFALSSPYTITADGGYYAAILQDGAFASTALQLSRLSNVAGPDKAISGFARPIAFGGSSKTDITGTLTLADPGGGLNYWFGAS